MAQSRPLHRTAAIRAAASTLVTLVLLLNATQASAQWEKLRGPTGGEVNTFFQHKGNIYAGTEGGGMFQSNDDGRSWNVVGSPSLAESVRAFLVKGNQFFAAASSGVLLSEDDGATCRVIGDSLPSLDVRGIAAQGDVLFVATWNGLARSTDNGATWRGIEHDSLDVPWFYSIAANDSVVIAGSDRRFYRSTDGGTTWLKATPSPTGNVRTIFNDGATFLVATEQGLTGSTDNGRTWRWLGGTDVWSVAIADNGTIYRASAGQQGLHRSNDSGKTWVRVENGASETSHTAVAVFGSIVLDSPYKNGVLRSTNAGATWTQSNDGMAAADVYTIGTNSTSIFAATDYNGLQRSTDLGVTWTIVSGDFESPQFVSLAIMGDTILAGTANPDCIYRSTDNGDRWDEIYCATGASSGGRLFVDGKDLYMGVRGLGRSTDNGDSWIPADNGLPEAYVTAFTSNGRAIFVGTNSAWNGTGAGIFRSNDKGANWTQLNTGLGPSIDIMSLIAIDDTILAATESGFYRSNDNGTTWGRVSLPTPSLFFKTGSMLFSNSLGARRSTDNGKTWEPFAEGMPAAEVTAFATIGDYLFAGTEGGSVARRRIQGLSGSVESPMEHAVELTLFPNPVEEGIATLVLPVTSDHVELQLYNGLGETIPAGERLRISGVNGELDLRDLPAGLYLLRLTVSGTMYTARVMVR